ncbi:TolC family protein [Acidithiobacillus montserratensis]|uniref:TolC family protein n=1 Tax=Acidithiobacillus montserratensis TaxID=2729135 RepID=A0ACD5HHT4_9PROT|nr:TolC family protein [Acidithiobacillus montserratensis]MBN2680489.1 TolC family protein [Acidithiobacillaceae bacterium]MBU2746728.1 TolC family protein [Acidithiobacillus montserratensis]
MLVLKRFFPFTARKFLIAASISLVPLAAHATPLSLDQAIASALHNQASIQVVRHQLAAQKNLSEAAQAQMLPALSLNAATIWTQSRAGQPVFVAANGAREMSGQIRLDIPIYAPQTRALSKLAKDQVDMETYRLQQNRLTVAAAVTMSYFKLAEMDNAIAVWKSAFVAAQQIYQTTKEGFTIGTRSRLALNQAELNVLRMHSQLSQTRILRKATQRVLALQTGLGQQLPPLIKMTPTLQPLPDFSVIEQQALQAQPLISVAESRIKAAQAQLEFHRGARLPVVSAHAAYGVNSSVIPHSGQLGWQAGLSLQMPLFGFGRNRDQIAAAQQQVAALQAAKSALEMQIRSRLAQDLGTAQATTIALKNAGKIADRANAVYQMTRKGYLAGAESALALQQAQSAWIQARLQDTNAMIRARLSRAQLALDSGRLPGQGPFS